MLSKTGRVIIKTVSLILALSIVFAVFTGCGDKSTVVVSDSDDSDVKTGDYKSAYVNTLYAILNKYGSYLDDVDYQAFGIFKLDADDTPEMIVNYSDYNTYFSEIYYFDGKEAQCVGRFGKSPRPYDRSADEASCYFVPQKSIIIESIESIDNTTTENIYTYKKGKAENAGKFAATDPDDASPLYFINDSVVSFEKYTVERRKYIPEGFEPEDVIDDDVIDLYMLTQSGISEFYSKDTAESAYETSSTTDYSFENETAAETLSSTEAVITTEAEKTTISEIYREYSTATTYPVNGPRNLYEMDTFTGDPTFEKISVRDTYGNDYDKIYRKNSAPYWGGSNEFSYLLNGNYSVASGTMIWAEAYKNDTTGYYTMEFYDGDRLVYETEKCSYISGPINFSFSVAGIKILTVKFNGYSNQGNFDFVTNLTVE